MTKTLRVLVVCAALLSSYAEACSCRGWRLPEDEKIRKEAETSEHIVLARVSEVTLSSPTIEGIVHVTGAFKPIETLKGRELETIPMEDEYLDGAFASSCNEGLPKLSVGDIALLYLEKPVVDEWTFSHCSRSRVIEAVDEDPEVMQLRGMKLRADG